MNGQWLVIDRGHVVSQARRIDQRSNDSKKEKDKNYSKLVQY